MLPAQERADRLTVVDALSVAWTQGLLWSPADRLRYKMLYEDEVTYFVNIINRALVPVTVPISKDVVQLTICRAHLRRAMVIMYHQDRAG